MTDALVWAVVAVLGTSFAVCALLVHTQRWHGRLSLDSDLNSVQKMHTTPVPRVGGLGMMVGLMIGIIVGHSLNGKTYPTVILLLGAAAPVFLAGIVEDLTKQVSVKVRLLASFLSGALAILLADAQLSRLDTPGLDALMVYGPVAFLFTSFAIGGMTHAINLIDGLNGLASGSAVLILAGLGAMAWQTDDLLVLKLCLWGIAALLGFMLLNFPFGRIFLGDGGAYLVGFWVAACAVLLLGRNQDVSTWAVLLAVLYPVWETVYSMYRRWILHKAQAGAPDSGHLHHLVFRHVSTILNGDGPMQSRRLAHSVTSSCLWIVVAVSQFAAVAWTHSHMASMIAVLSGVAALSRLHAFLATTETRARNKAVAV